MESEKFLIKISGVFFSLFSSGGSRMIFTLGVILFVIGKHCSLQEWVLCSETESRKMLDCRIVLG